MTRDNSSADLGGLLRNGDETVLEVVLRTHGPPILALLKRRFVGPLTATDLEDVLATALFRMWQTRGRYDPVLSSLRVWFYRIAENVARDVLKHGWHKARQLELSIDPALLATATDRRWDQGSTDDNENRDRETGPTLRVHPELLRELLALLPEPQRRIVLADADSPDGLVASQTLAAELGIPQGTVRVYRRRALERLRREIELRELADDSVE